MLEIRFEFGSLVLDGIADSKNIVSPVPGFTWDKRTYQWRAPAYVYREAVLYLLSKKILFSDKARAYQELELKHIQSILPREQQKQGLKAWQSSGQRGVVSLPTGVGKTILAILAMLEVKRPTLIVAPTIDLILQWEKVLKQFLDGPIGMLGGGNKDIEHITVATYDSAALFMENIGQRFGFLVFDECHHLPAPHYQKIALASIAPFRIGLSATVERQDGKEKIIYDLIGPMVYRTEINEIIKKILAPYEVINVEIPLTSKELEVYKKHRAEYLQFIHQSGIRFSSDNSGWLQFISLASRSKAGRSAFKAYRLQKRLAQAAEGKLTYIWKLLARHKKENMIIFTDDNALAYRIGSDFFLPVLTHKTKTAERKNMLSAFRDGKLKVLVTSKVLNEGVDVPEASVGVVVSGSSGVREHVQRLGRILRHREGKQAKLYELVAKNTAEFYVNQRRRQHIAYQRRHP